MIGRLRGEIIHKRPPWLMLDVSGVGYELETPMSTFFDLPGIGETAALYTHLQVREDAHTLYGFATEVERDLFRSLLKVSGVGAKMALGVLSGMGVKEFSRCILDQDSVALVRLPGIGRKTAERLIVEMRDRVDGDTTATFAETRGRQHSAVPNEIRDAVNALIALGYKPQEAARMVESVDSSGCSSEEIIRSALRTMVK